jgi:hypothetical protein
MRREYRIHPAIGIARLGNSPERFFIGPEAPGVSPSLNEPDTPPSPQSTYKDDQRRIKRQGARFRVYEYTFDDANALAQVREITAADAQIEWEVHLVNRKAAAPQFNGPHRRNKTVQDESKLIIDAGVQTIRGAGEGKKRLQGSFMGTVVPLGDLLTDRAGRLIVLGGFGASRSMPGAHPLDNTMFADNDGWCDDVSDGPVRARVRLNGAAETLAAEGAWVTVGPPDFAPVIQNVITLYDLVYEVAAQLDPSLALAATTPVSFTRDIYPILRRASFMHWVTDLSLEAHSPGKSHYFLDSQRLQQLLSNNDKSVTSPARQRREKIFRALRRPGPGGGGGTMPFLSAGTTTVTLTKEQYHRMERWAHGDFEADWTGQEPTPQPLDSLPLPDQPHALDRAALEACVGAGLFPGIEAGRIMRDPLTYRRPFRIASTLDGGQMRPGDLTERMAVPWQSDFMLCTNQGSTGDWWPAQRPNQVLRGQERVNWADPLETGQDMVDHWSKLGFIVEEESAGTVRYVEKERSL